LTIGNEAITKGLKKALMSMKKGEKATVRVAPAYAYGSAGNSQLGIPPNASLVYEILLLDFEKGKENLNEFKEKLEQATRLRTDGNSFFEKAVTSSSSEILSLALTKYKKALDLFKYEGSISDDEKASVKKDVKIPCHANLAACYLKKKDYKKTVENATKTLELDGNNVKALWRRGVAHTERGDWHEAKLDLTKALELDPENKAVKNSMTQLRKHMAQQNEKDKKRYGNLFQRLQELEKKEQQQQAQQQQQTPQQQQPTVEETKMDVEPPAAASEIS